MPATLFRCITAIFVLILPLAVAAAAAPPAPARPVATVVTEPHPEIRAAIRALERARLRLQRAAHDFGGHRVAAIAAIDAALVQLKVALQYDKD